ncbi:MAG: flagellar basal body L-ring protein FlgH [Terriglobales bacterium]
MKRILTMRLPSRWTFTLLLTTVLLSVHPAWSHSKKENSEQLRAEYLARVQEQTPSKEPSGTLGSLYSPNGAFTDLSADYKARRVGDVVTLVVFENTTAQSTGDVNTSRAYQTNSAITGLPGGTSTSILNPLFAANSATTLKGTGETSAGSNVTTTLTARVIGLLPSGSLIVEAERRVLINSQHETVVVRGVLRPGDVGPNNTATSTSLANLEIELKGKGVVTDAIHRPNPVIRGLQWLFSF